MKTFPRSYELKRLVAKQPEIFWLGGELSKLPSAVIYSFPDARKFWADVFISGEDADQILSTNFCFPYEHFILEIANTKEMSSMSLYTSVYINASDKELVRCYFFSYKQKTGWSNTIGEVLFKPVFDFKGGKIHTYFSLDINPKIERKLPKDLPPPKLEMVYIIARALKILAREPSVRIEHVPNNRRKSFVKTKTPSWAYRIVDIDLSKLKDRNKSLGGSHASPRWHIRRGHWRTLPSGRRVFVKACQVGDRRRGGIVKDYQVLV